MNRRLLDRKVGLGSGEERMKETMENRLRIEEASCGDKIDRLVSKSWIRRIRVDAHVPSELNGGFPIENNEEQDED
ncbi:hypothetical protein RIF29_33346 [Crotalaria pallida]|uniref:Uncharacterized protein n=1 Tax=Crotalaria pallida TaxID=3830 RepID=A0AAN9EDL0_CROPI